MKKRDEIEDEILDDEEFLDDEEILDDEEFDDDDLIDDEEEEDEDDEKPTKKAKKSKKGGKKKLGKGAVIGISVGSVVAFLAIAVVLVMFVILPMLGGSGEANGAGSYTATVGAKAPTGLTAKTPINKNMNTAQMLLAAVDNYYDADYAANIMVIGGVKTNVLGMSIAQGVQSFKYRDGKGDAAAISDKTNSSQKAKYYVYSRSSGIAKMCEEYYAEGTAVKYRKANTYKNEKLERTTVTGKVKKVDYLVGTKWDKTIKYDTIKGFYDATSTDFTKLWSYKVDENTILNATDKVSYNSEEDIYYLTAKLDLVKATEDYLGVMKNQLQTNMGMTVNTLEFKKLELECAIYGNGYFKYIIVHEAYAMDLGGVPVIGSLNGMTIANDCINEYTFDKTEKIPYEVVENGKITAQDFDYATLIKKFK